mmetsp:Transcript_66777/g.108330  ORF Transcript_66777/g.108330 Transcript_66777/m.108330 type:complete len:121 (+) Transcript_66777:522-884(+)
MLCYCFGIVLTESFLSLKRQAGHPSIKYHFINFSNFMWFSTVVVFSLRGNSITVFFPTGHPTSIWDSGFVSFLCEVSNDFVYHNYEDGRDFLQPWFGRGGVMKIREGSPGGGPHMTQTSS